MIRVEIDQCTKAGLTAEERARMKELERKTLAYLSPSEKLAAIVASTA